MANVQNPTEPSLVASNRTILCVYSLPPHQETDLGTRSKWLSKTSAFTSSHVCRIPVCILQDSKQSVLITFPIAVKEELTKTEKEWFWLIVLGGISLCQ